MHEYLIAVIIYAAGPGIRWPREKTPAKLNELTKPAN